MNQIMYREEQEIKNSKKKSNFVKIIVSIILGSLLLSGSFLIAIKLYDMNKPIFVPEETKLDLYIYENNIIIEAYNSQGLESLTYMWQGKQRYNLNANSQDKSKLSVTIPILSGENTLYVEVLDSNGNTKVKEQKIKGVTEAKIRIQVQNGYFLVDVTDDEKIQSIQYEFNGINYSLDIGDTKQFNFMKKLEYGQNHIKVTVQNLQGIYSTEEMKYEH